MTTHIAVTGATGGIGGRVARLLADRGIRQRLIVRDRGRAPKLPGAEVVVGDFTDASGFRDAVAGARVLFLVSGPEARERDEVHRRAIEAAVAGGIERIVYTSFLNAAHDATFTFARDHAGSEEVLAASGVPWVALRNSIYQDMVPLFVGDDGVIRGPAADGRASFVARDDIAAVAAACLLDPALLSGPADVTGPEAVTLHEAARVLGEITGRDISYQPETVEEARVSRVPTGAPDWEIEGWVTSYLAVATGELETVADTVERVTGRPAVDLRTWLKRTPAAWRHLCG